MTYVQSTLTTSNQVQYIVDHVFSSGLAKSRSNNTFQNESPPPPIQLIQTSYRPRASIIDHSLNFYTPIITYLDSPHSKLLCKMFTLTIFASCIVVFNNNTAIQITEIVYVLKLSYFINNNTVIQITEF